MCIPGMMPKTPSQSPFAVPPAPLAPPPASATAESVKQAGAGAAVTPPKKPGRNPLRTDSGATDSVATGLNIPQ